MYRLNYNFFNSLSVVERITSQFFGILYNYNTNTTRNATVNQLNKSKITENIDNTNVRKLFIFCLHTRKKKSKNTHTHHNYRIYNTITQTILNLNIDAKMIEKLYFICYIVKYCLTTSDYENFHTIIINKIK